MQNFLSKEMELLRLSKFKLQLRALTAELRDLRERDQSTTEQLHLSIQKQKKTEEDFSRKIQELQTELASSQEFQHKLEKKVEYLQNDNILLEHKQKELKTTIESLLQSRDSFLSIYEDSTSDLKRSIEIRDRKLALLSEKVHAHGVLFDLIAKEAVSVKEVVDNVQLVVSEKEDIVSGLKRKLDQVSAFEKEFVEKICLLENKLRCNNEEIRKKDTTISELEGKLEAEKMSNNWLPQIEELQKSLSMKEDIIQNLNTENKALRFEVRGLETTLLKFQEAITTFNAEEQKVFSCALKGPEECPTTSEKETTRSNDMVQEGGEESSGQDCLQGAEENTGSPKCQEHISAQKSSPDKHNIDSCVSEGNCSQLVHQQLDSETSTSEAETKENTGDV